MQLSSGLKTAGFVTACLIWLLAGLTLLGPKVGEQFIANLSGGPKQPLALTCPKRLGLNEKGDIVARFTNHSDKTQDYNANIEAQTTGETHDMSAACSPIDPLAAGETGIASCAIGPITTVQRVRLTVWAEGEDYHGTCDLGCANSYSGSCVITPDIWPMLLQADSLSINAVILALGLALVVFGMKVWPNTGSSGRILMAGFFMASALMLAFAVYQTFDHWLAPALVIGPLPEAILVAALWLRGHPQIA